MKTKKLCKRCNDAPAHEVFRAPCGCENAFCAACTMQADFQSWLAGYTKLHQRVGGRYRGGSPLPCPTGVEFQANFTPPAKPKVARRVRILP